MRKKTTAATGFILMILLTGGVAGAADSVCTIGASTSIVTTGAADFCADQRAVDPSGSFSGTWCSTATAITLLSFTATPSSDAITLAWQTGAEMTNAGFRLWRSTQETAAYARITPAIIAAKGNPSSGATYSYKDAGVSAGTTYYYKLQDIDTKGKATLHGPVSTHVTSTALTLASPADNASFPETAPSFEWTADGLDRFRVQFSPNSAFTKKVVTLPGGWLKTAHFTPTPAQWRAVANLGKGATAMHWRVIGIKAGKKAVPSDAFTLAMGGSQPDRVNEACASCE